MRSRWLAVVAASCMLLPAISGRTSAADGAPITQQRINEIAAAVLETHLALEEARPGPLAGESSAAYLRRLTGYAAQMERASSVLGAVEARPALANNARPNVDRWNRIGDAARRLASEIGHYRKQVGAKA